MTPKTAYKILSERAKLDKRGNVIYWQRLEYFWEEQPDGKHIMACKASGHAFAGAEGNENLTIFRFPGMEKPELINQEKLMIGG